MPVACKKCGMEFSTGPEVGAHARAEHSNSTKEQETTYVPYVCYSCPADFATHMELSKHRGEHEHPDEKFWGLYAHKYPVIDVFYYLEATDASS